MARPHPSLKEINETRKITMVFTTHDRLLAAGLAHHTLVLNKGRLVTTSYENIFPCKIEPVSDSQVRCHLPGNTSIFLSSTTMPAGTTTSRLFIAPEKIRLYAADKASNSSPCLQGKVVQLMEEAARIRAVIDVGFLLTVLHRRKEYDTLRPGIGDTVAVSLAEDAVILSN